MFTGIVRALGRIQSIHHRQQGAQVIVQSEHMPALQIGDSIAVNGCCVTVTALGDSVFHADISSETISKTTWGLMQDSDVVNLEPALTLGDALGGHWVSGHVDDCAIITAIEPVGDSWQVSIQVGRQWQRFIAPKGSVTLDGISLTVNDCIGDCFTVALIPHTRQHTIAQFWAVGQHINLEIDVLARYILHARKYD